MQNYFTPDRVRKTIAAADTVARRLEWRLRLPPGSEDLQQDLLIDLLRRLPSYDPRRGTPEAFAQIVFTHCAARIAQRIGRERRNRGALLSLDCLSMTIRGRCASALPRERSSGRRERRPARRPNAGTVLALLPEGDREICAGVATQTPAGLARTGIGSRSQLYRRVADLRCVLTATASVPPGTISWRPE